MRLQFHQKNSGVTHLEKYPGSRASAIGRQQLEGLGVGTLEMYIYIYFFFTVYIYIYTVQGTNIYLPGEKENHRLKSAFL